MIFFSLFNNRRRDDDSKQKAKSIIEWPDHIVTLDGNNFNMFIKNYPLSIVDFWAPWCVPCKTMSPRLRRLSKIYNGKVAIGKLDTQKNQNIAKQYKIMGIPHLIFFSYGKKVISFTGVKSIGIIKNMIDELLQKGENI